MLRERRVVGGALTFEVVNRLGDGQALVVSRQVLVPNGDNSDEAVRGLTERHFEKRPLSANDPRCQALHDLVSVYEFQSGTDEEARDAVDEALASLRDQGMDVSPTMLAALHMVVKSVDGPAPTLVTVADFPPEGAVPTSADGEIVIAVIDTGIVEELRGDGWLNEVARHNNAGNTDDVVDKLDTLPHNELLDFGAGHGTFVAGIIRQVDPQAKIVAYRALESDGLASEEAVACAMLRAAEDNVHVISLSLGMKAVDDARPCPFLQTAVEQILARDNPPAIVASAGNYGDTDRVYPAALPDVVSVAALRAVEDAGSDQLEGAAWSTHGDWVKCSAVGEGIVSTFVKGEEDPEFGGNDVYPQGGEGDSWAVWSGTSFAAPQIAAQIAINRRGGKTAKAAVNALLSGNPPVLSGYGQPVVLLLGTPT